MHEVLSELRGLRAFVGDRLDAIDAHFEDMDTRITQLEEDIGFIHRCFDQPPAP